MTIEQVIGMSAAELVAMTNEDLEKHFGQYLLVTRPENAPKEKKAVQQMLAVNPNFERARQIAAQAGIIIPAIAPKFKRR